MAFRAKPFGLPGPDRGARVVVALAAAWCVGCGSRSSSDVGSSGAAPQGPPRQSLFVRGVMVPNPFPDCTLRAEADALLRETGTVDVALTSRYVADLLVGHIGATLDAGTDESAMVTVRAVDVVVTDDGGAEVVRKTVTSGATIDPPFAHVPSYATVEIPVFHDDATLLSAHAGARLTATFVVHGTALDGTDVVSSAFPYAIEVCDGCLITFPPDTADFTKPLPNCGNAVGDMTAFEVCRLGQDDPVHCSVCATINARCR